jgi:glycosyltransferase involved in cell wall biosynthesis
MTILEAQIEKEKHKDPRTVMHLARVYFDKGKITEKEEQTKWLNKALVLFNEYLEGTGELGSKDYHEASGWREERAAAWDHVGAIAVLQKNPKVAIEVLKNAVDEGYEFPLYYVNLAWVYTMVKDFKRAKNLLNYATTLPEPHTTIVMYPRELKTRMLQVSIEINMHERNLKLALEDAKLLEKFYPKDEQVKKTILVLESLIDFNQACQSVMFLGKYLERAEQKDKIPYLLKSMTREMEQEKFASEMKHLYLPNRIWEKNTITILCGPGVEKWSPKSVDTGIGGSEEAVIQMGKELTKLGWKVTVYSNPLDEAGTYDGVEYKQWYDINTNDNFNVLILWRGIGFVDIKPKANFIMVWMHDIPNNPDFTKERVDKVDKIAALSEYHKSLLRMNDGGKFIPIPDNKILVTSNGIPPSTVSDWKGNPKRLIYMSSPDRGLIYLLDYWPEIRRRIPNAELHIFYGFNVFDVLHQNNPAKMIWKEQIMKMMQQKGITYHGRVNHKELEKEINLSGVWAYPCSFEEISCISAMKAQAAGAVPVVTNYAALKETVRNGLKIDVDITTKEGQKDYIEALTKLIEDPKKQEELRKNMMSWAQDYYLWQHVAERWDKVLRVGIEDVSKKLIIEGGV